MLTDFIHRYEGVLVKKTGQEIIEYINLLENDGCLIHENEASHLQDQYSNNLIAKDKYELDLGSAHRICQKVLPKVESACRGLFEDI